jgi:hypothetical protein
MARPGPILPELRKRHDPQFVAGEKSRIRSSGVRGSIRWRFPTVRPEVMDPTALASAIVLSHLICLRIAFWYQEFQTLGFMIKVYHVGKFLLDRIQQLLC